LIFTKVQLIFLVTCLFLLSLLDLFIINEEVLLCLCFTAFTFLAFASLNVSALNNLEQKSNVIKTTLLVSINKKLNFFSEKSLWFFLNNFSQKPLYVFFFYDLLGCCELRLNLFKANKLLSNGASTWLGDSNYSYDNNEKKRLDHFLRSSIYGQAKKV